MRPSDVDEVVRIIRLHDSDDAAHAQRYFEQGPAFSGDPGHGHVVCESAQEDRVMA